MTGSYQEQLRDPRWQRLRLAVFARDHFACTQCGATTQTLHVHHLHYDRQAAPWEYDMEVLRTLCDDCHGAIHHGKAVVVVWWDDDASGWFARRRTECVRLETRMLTTHAMAEAADRFGVTLDKVGLAA